MRESKNLKLYDAFQEPADIANMICRVSIVQW